jgi:hypothetical protein
MLSRKLQSLGASGVSLAFCVLERIMPTDPKEQDGIKDEALEHVSGGTEDDTAVQPVQAPEPDVVEELYARFPEPR